MNFIKSPINYTGNKYRLLPQIIPYFPKNPELFVDLFCGGATVGSNVCAKRVMFIDSNMKVINLLRYISQADFMDFHHNITAIINRYRLSNSSELPYAAYIRDCPSNNKNNGLKEFNKEGFYALRSDYNAMPDKQNEQAQLLLYVLMVYAFNNDIRFNKKGEFNLPVGKTDLNAQNLRKVRAFTEQAKNRHFEFVCGDFRNKDIKNILYESDFVYADPPYLITCAVYNEADGWNMGCEQSLLQLYTDLLESHIPFLFSNILRKVGQDNDLLCNWVNKNEGKVETINLNYNYRSSSYNKKNRDAREQEVIVRSI